MLTIAKTSKSHLFKPIILRTVATDSVSDIKNQDEIEWRNARPFSEIPGPNKFQLLKAFTKVGPFHGIHHMELHKKMRDMYGTLVKLPGMFGKRTVIFALSPNHCEKVFRTEGSQPTRRGVESFKYYRTKVRPEIFRGMGGLVSDQGDKWFKLRSIVNPVMMQPKIVKSYIPAVDNVTQDFVYKLKLMLDDNKEAPDDFGSELNQWALESIGVIALNHRLGVLSPDVKPEAALLIKSVKDFFKIAFVLENEPSLWRYYQTSKFKQLMAAFDVMTDTVMTYVDSAIVRIENSQAGGIPTSENSVLHKLLKIDRHYAILMSFDMLLAGIETTASASANFIHAMAVNPDKQEMLRKEIMKILPKKNSKLTTESLNNLPYMRACIKESMRIQPLFAGNLRATGRDIVLDGYRIPKDTDIALGTGIHYCDDKYFPDGAKFLPERWLREDKKGAAVGKTVNPFVYLPFGYGPRTCIGKRFAELEMQILMARLLREFKIEWEYGQIEYAASTVISPISKLKFKLTQL